ncbi:ribose 5-phosphate isomerase B [Candidatus Marinamargulisbacteria bacterium SCGC AG-333-B06]|nr:ribose 5-phosphate isomerase B [Candidatus Marinamargulisbacteria bacterium SCGC AG-333-B06]
MIVQIIMGSDHGGYELKEALKESLSQNKALSIDDMGTLSTESVDYPDIADAVAKKVLAEKAIGILCCGTGIGISIRANRHKGIRAAVVFNEFTAEMAKKHNNANILCLGGRTTTLAAALTYVNLWLKHDFEGDRHLRRIKKLDA